VAAKKLDFSVPRRQTSAPSLSFLQNVKKPVRSTDRKWNQATMSLKDISGDSSSMSRPPSLGDCRPVVMPVRRESFENMSIADIISIALDGLDRIDMDDVNSNVSRQYNN
jgi:hypothetical protein